MKKTLLTLIAAILVLVSFTNDAKALGNATLQLAPTSREVSVGQRFNLTVRLSPNGESIDTVRALVKFPPNLLFAESVVLNGALNSTSPGNYIDNSQGLISWGGFTTTSPATAAGNFASLTFRAQSTGEATVLLQPGSRAISNGEEKINPSGLNSALITISSPPPPASGQRQGQRQNLVLTSPTHPDQDAWYQARDVEFNWTTNPAVSSFLWAFDKDPETEPVKKLSGNAKTFSKTQEGIWYFHLKAESDSPVFSQTQHYRVQIDYTKPKKFEAYLDVDTEDKLTLMFGTTDELSGIAKYELQTNGGDFVESASPQTLQNLEIGENNLIVRAYDLAGNVRESQNNFVINEDGSISRLNRGLSANFGLPLVLFLLLMLLLLLFWKRRRRKRKED